MVERKWAGFGIDGNFQYSLCRVVLMVAMMSAPSIAVDTFQYSLCRVVLMVSALTPKRSCGW